VEFFSSFRMMWRSSGSAPRAHLDLADALPADAMALAEIGQRRRFIAQPALPQDLLLAGIQDLQRVG
jgi:hypothetical protein